MKIKGSIPLPPHSSLSEESSLSYKTTVPLTTRFGVDKVEIGTADVEFGPEGMSVVGHVTTKAGVEILTDHAAQFSVYSQGVNGGKQIEVREATLLAPVHSRDIPSEKLTKLIHEAIGKKLGHR